MIIDFERRHRHLFICANLNIFFMPIVIVVLSIMPAVVPSNCPLLHSFLNDTGALIYNKTAMVHTGPTMRCQWLIVASKYQRIVIEFDYVFIPVPVEEYLKTGCRGGSINLWTPGLENEKVEICGDRHKIRVGGVGQTLVVEFRLDDLNLDARFTMRYQLVAIEQALSTPTYLSDSLTSSKENYAECGRTSTSAHRTAREGLSSRIVGGHQVVPHSYPWQVLLNDRGKFCGATVLNANWIITAAHCVNGTNFNNISAEFGMHDRYINERSRITRTIKRIVVYPFYSGKSTRWIHDIALLELSESIILNPFIRPICLPLTRHEFVRVGDRTTVTGWGETQGTGNFRYLRKVEVPIQSMEQCGITDGSLLTTTLCAGLCQNSTCDACQGDSGGPMVLLKNDRWYLTGLISWGFSCSGLGVYTKISFYTDWITKIINV